MSNIVSFKKNSVESVAAEDKPYWIQDLTMASYTAAFLDNDMEGMELLQAELTKMLKAKQPFTRLPLAIRKRCATSLGASKAEFLARTSAFYDVIYTT